MATVAAVAAGTLAAPTVAQSPVQTTFTVDASIIPERVGTPKNPRGIKIKAAAKFTAPANVEKPILTHGYVLFPRLGSWNGGRYPKCSEKTLRRDGGDGLKYCPKGSIIGQGKATGWADTVVARADVTAVNGGQKRGFGYVKLYNPAFVLEVVPADIKELKSGKWRYKVSVTIPQTLRVVAGVPIAPRDIRGTIGRKKIITSTGCPKSKRAPYLVKAFFENGTDYEYEGSVACKPALSD